MRPPNGGRRNAAIDHAIRKCAFSPNCWGTGGGWGVGWKWIPIGGLQYQTHMQAPKYDVQFLRSEALRSSSSSSRSSSRTRQIKECYIRMRKTVSIHKGTILFVWLIFVLPLWYRWNKDDQKQIPRPTGELECCPTICQLWALLRIPPGAYSAPKTRSWWGGACCPVPMKAPPKNPTQFSALWVSVPHPQFFSDTPSFACLKLCRGDKTLKGP